MATMTVAKALNAGLRRALEADPKVLLYGEDIGKLGGVFRITEHLQRDFGPERVIDSPLAESGIVGTALDFTPTVLILTPVLMPVVIKAGIDPVYFGVLFIMNNAIGLITPPVGTVLNVVSGVARISMDDAFKGVMPFFIAHLVVLFLLVFFPEIVTVPLQWWMGR